MSVKKNSECSTCSQASEDSALGLNQPGLFKRLPSASKTSFAKPCLESTGPTSQSSTTLDNSEARNPHSQMELISSAAGSRSRASLGPKPGSKEARKMTATSGRKWLPLLESYGLSGSLARTCEALLTSQWGSSAVYLTWRASAIKPSHLLFQLAPSRPRTDGIASGLWPTAQAWDGKRGARKPDGKRGMALSDLSAPQMWPTPQHRDFRTGEAHRFTDPQRSQNLNDAVAFWPTPTASDHKGSGPTLIRKDGKNRLNDRLDYATEQREPSGGQLNPTWVEWLMGFPAGWTSLTPQELQTVSKTESRGSKHSATQSSRNSSQKSEER